MLSIKRSLNQLKDFLHEILETPINNKINARLGQQLRVEDKVLDRNGPITIIQNQEVKPIIVINISKALRMIDDMQFQIDQSTVNFSLEDILEKMLADGVTWIDLQRKIKNRYFSMALKKAKKDQKEAARLIGVGRSTITTHFNQMGFTKNSKTELEK
jgi:hypothetical protein